MTTIKQRLQPQYLLLNVAGCFTTILMGFNDPWVWALALAFACNSGHFFGQIKNDLKG